MYVYTVYIFLHELLIRLGQFLSYTVLPTCVVLPRVWSSHVTSPESLESLLPRHIAFVQIRTALNADPLDRFVFVLAMDFV